MRRGMGWAGTAAGCTSLGRWARSSCRRGTALGLLAVVPACASASGTVRRVNDVQFSEASSVQVPIDRDGRGRLRVAVGLAGQLVMNYRSDPVRVTHVEAVADDGLTATYVGHSKCLRGCPGAVLLNPDTEQRFLKDGLDGVYPLDLPPGKQEEMLLFRLEVDGQRGAERLIQRCGLYVRHAIFTSVMVKGLRYGSTERVATSSAYTQSRPPCVKPTPEMEEASSTTR